jgi:hypothetical protein
MVADNRDKSDIPYQQLLEQIVEGTRTHEAWAHSVTSYVHCTGIGTVCVVVLLHFSLWKARLMIANGRS